MNTITVKNGNVILDVMEDEKDYYMNKGYSVIDEKGKVVEEAMSQDVASLQLQVIQLKQEIADLKAKLAEKPKPATRAKKTEKAEKE